jgi:hypothetical protein
MINSQLADETIGENEKYRKRLVPLRGSQKSKVKSQKEYRTSFLGIWNGSLTYADLY